MFDALLRDLRIYRRATRQAWYRVKLGIGVRTKLFWTREPIENLGILTVVDVERWDRHPACSRRIRR